MSFFNYTSLIDKQDSYFAAANTKDGFISYFNETFAQVPKIYVIKGGPGTGKSTLMRKIAAEGKNRGYKVQKYYCSSDSSSLDGVIVEDKFAVIDGTAPHATEPRYAGAVDEIINLCEMWNAEKLISQKDEICNLSKEISARYQSVYRLLNSMATLEREYLEIVKKHINHQKLKKFTDKLALMGDTSQKAQSTLCDAVGVYGRVHFNCFERDCKKIIYLGGKYHEAEILLQYLKQSLEDRQVGYEISLSPESLEACAIRISDKIALVCIAPPDGIKAFNTQRFLYPSIKQDKNRLKEIERICQDVGDIACSELEIIGRLHDKLEDHYKSAMDYDKLDRFTKKLLIKMFC